MAKSIQEYLDSQVEHLDIITCLRRILLTTELHETLKWGIPTYQINGKNVLGIGSFKSYAGLWFFNGVFLEDKAKVLINAQDGKTKGMRQWRFASIDEVNEQLVKEYVLEAIQNQKDGREVKAERKPLIIPDELKEMLASDSQLSESFDAMNLTMKREYAEYIAEAKRAQTKVDRLQKIIPMIKAGVGFYDKYKT